MFHSNTSVADCFKWETNYRNTIWTSYRKVINSNKELHHSFSVTSGKKHSVLWNTALSSCSNEHLLYGQPWWPFVELSRSTLTSSLIYSLSHGHYTFKCNAPHLHPNLDSLSTSNDWIFLNSRPNICRHWGACVLCSVCTCQFSRTGFSQSPGTLGLGPLDNNWRVTEKEWAEGGGKKMSAKATLNLQCPCGQISTHHKHTQYWILPARVNIHKMTHNKHTRTCLSANTYANFSVCSHSSRSSGPPDSSPQG